MLGERTLIVHGEMVYKRCRRIPLCALGRASLVPLRVYADNDCSIMFVFAVVAVAGSSASPFGVCHVRILFTIVLVLVLFLCWG